MTDQPLRAELDEVRFPGRSYSRRPRARACGLEVVATTRGDAVVCALCRRLVAAGHDPATPLEVYRGETLALRVRSIGAAAGLTVEERPTGGLRFGAFQDRPSFAQGRDPDAFSEGTPMSDTPEGSQRAQGVFRHGADTPEAMP